jgi:hypothetical protein
LKNCISRLVVVVVVVVAAAAVVVPPQPPFQGFVSHCNQIMLLTLYEVSYRLVTFLIFIYTSAIASNIFVLTVCSKRINFVFQIFPLLFLKCAPASQTTLFRLSAFICLTSCNHNILACFLRANYLECTLSKCGLCCFSL